MSLHARNLKLKGKKNYKKYEYTNNGLTAPHFIQCYLT